MRGEREMDWSSSPLNLLFDESKEGGVGQKQKEQMWVSGLAKCS